MIEGEAELDKHLDRGYTTPSEWVAYWWGERAKTLQDIDALRMRINILQGYVERCSERIKRVPERTTDER